MKKIKNMNEAAWVLGIILCALGVALLTKASFGLSMISAPPYIFHIRLSQISSFFTQGTCEYLWEFFLLILLCTLIRKFRLSFILSFLCAILFGLMLDLWLMLLGGGGVYETLLGRILAFISGEIITSLSIAFFFRTDMPLLIYELIIREISKKWNINPCIVKYANDFLMLVFSFLLAIFLNGDLRGIGIGTVIVTIINAPLITYLGALLDRIFKFNSLFRKEKL